MGENITGPLRIGVLFRYLTKLRIKQAKRKAAIRPVTIPNSTLRMILRTPFLKRGQDMGGVEFVDKVDSEEARRLEVVFSSHFAADKGFKEKNKRNRIVSLNRSAFFPIRTEEVNQKGIDNSTATY